MNPTDLTISKTGSIYFLNNIYNKLKPSKTFYIDLISKALGIVFLNKQEYFLYIKDFSILNKEYYKLNQIEFLNLETFEVNDYNSNIYKKFYEEQFMFFSEKLEREFCWNENFIKRMRRKLENENGIAYLYCGYFNIIDNMQLISLISQKRIGPRKLVRGIDENGNVANYVKTIFAIDNFTYMIYRGTIPLFWQELNNDIISTRLLKPALYYISKHMHNFTILNLLEKSHKLNQPYKELCEIFKLDYFEFDLNKYQLNPPLLKIEYEKILEQMGDIEHRKIRVNCHDSLDRTNVAQLYLIQHLLHKKKIIFNEVGFRKLWAENGNYLSLLYTGTNAHKNEISRLGKRTFKGILGDIKISTQRIFNSFFDEKKFEIMQALIPSNIFLHNQKLNFLICYFTETIDEKKMMGDYILIVKYTSPPSFKDYILISQFTENKIKLYLYEKSNSVNQFYNINVEPDRNILPSLLYNIKYDLSKNGMFLYFNNGKMTYFIKILNIYENKEYIFKNKNEVNIIFCSENNTLVTNPSEYIVGKEISEKVFYFNCF